MRECGRKLLGEQRLLEASMTEPELDGAARKAALWRFRAVVANRQHLLSLTERVRLADTKPHRDLQRAYYELRRLVAEAITVQSNWYRHVSVAQPIPLLGRRPVMASFTTMIPPCGERMLVASIQRDAFRRRTSEG